ncbi:MAG: PepSY-associated TM helix domain-containing protein [Pseudomonadota bacterium]
MPRRLKPTNRKIHYWGSIVIALPLSIVLVSGLFLLLKKDVDWIQPPTIKGTQEGMMLDFEEVLSIARSVPEAGVESWSDVDRIDLRPGKGMLKVRSQTRWEIQIDTHSGEILQVAYRRSDIIESIHDGSFFGDSVKLWVFLPAALVLLGLWITGLVLFVQPQLVKARKRRSRVSRLQRVEEGL